MFSLLWLSYGKTLRRLIYGFWRITDKLIGMLRRMHLKGRELTEKNFSLFFLECERLCDEV